MTDFNPAFRQEQDFRLPPKQRSILGEFFHSLQALPTTIRGVDLSHWNGEVDFYALKQSGIEFVILKATEGTSIVDDKFIEYWQSAHSLELPIIPYHFFLSNLGGSGQATYHRQALIDTGFLETVKYKTPLVMADVETNDGATVSQRQNRLLAFHETTTAYGFQSGHYSSPYLWNSLVGNVAWASNYIGWAAHWTSADEPSLPLNWTKNSTKFWQYGIYPTHAWVEPVKGVPGAVDADRFYGTLQDLKNLLGIPQPMECCDELFAEVKRLQQEYDQLREEFGLLESRVDTNDTRISSIESLIKLMKDTFCN